MLQAKFMSAYLERTQMLHWQLATQVEDTLNAELQAQSAVAGNGENKK